MTHLVAALVQDGNSPFELAVAHEVFGTERPELGPPLYAFRLCAPGGHVSLNGGLGLTTPFDLAAADEADTVIVPSGTPTPGGSDPELVATVRRAAERGARILSYCSGAFPLADAGVLDGRRATTHWLYSERFRRAYPRVHLDCNVLFVDDGDVLTSAGTAAAIDLSLHVVRRDHGADVAHAVARRMVVPPHRDGGQAQYIEPPHAPLLPGDDIAPLLDWVRERLDEPIGVSDMAAAVAMSERTFARRFKEVAGTTPHRWLTSQRIHRAQELLERTDLDVDAVAARCGLGTGANLRQHFQREVGTTPARYRRQFHRRTA